MLLVSFGGNWSLLLLLMVFLFESFGVDNEGVEDLAND
jgi:hypothetical protein